METCVRLSSGASFSPSRRPQAHTHSSADTKRVTTAESTEKTLKVYLVLPEIKDQNLVLTVLYVPQSLNSGLLFFITLKPRVECYTQSMSLTYEPASEPLHISVK